MSISSSAPAGARRIALAMNALVAAVALLIKFVGATTSTDPRFPTLFGRVTNELCYFTIQSNIIVLAVCLAMACRPEWQWVSRVPRLVGLVCITITSVVYYSLLAGDEHFVGPRSLAGRVTRPFRTPLARPGAELAIPLRGSPADR